MGKKLTRPKQRYSDEDRATALLFLATSGYPEKKGALAQVVKSTGIPSSTLTSWYKNKINPPPSKIRNKKKRDLGELLDDELRDVFEQMKSVRDQASYRDLGVVSGILLDKQILMESGGQSQVKIQVEFVRPEDPVGQVVESDEVEVLSDDNHKD